MIKVGSSQFKWAIVSATSRFPATVSENSDKLLPDVLLEQNYPNPFNPLTTIRYSVAHDCRVILEIFSSLGEKARVLVDEQQEAGVYQTVLDGSTLASGVYIYRLRTEGTAISRKILLLR